MADSNSCIVSLWTAWGIYAASGRLVPHQVAAYWEASNPSAPIHQHREDEKDFQRVPSLNRTSGIHAQFRTGQHKPTFHY